MNSLNLKEKMSVSAHFVDFVSIFSFFEYEYELSLKSKK